MLDRALIILIASGLLINFLCVRDAHAGEAVVGGQDATLSEGLHRLVDSGRIPGAVVMIERDGEVLNSAVVGWLDVESEKTLPIDALFRLYSMSKPITSVAVMMLAEQGLLKLEDPAHKYLPEFANMEVYVSGDLENMVTEPLKEPITIAQLLTHTSGITYHFAGKGPVHQYYRKHGVMRDTPVGRSVDDARPARNLDELVLRIGNAPLLRQPSTQFDYSYSTTVLGAIIERVMGKRLDEALKELLFDPLNMDDTGFFVSDDELARFTTLYLASPGGLSPIEQVGASDYRDKERLLDGGGGLVGTAADYIKFLSMLANGGVFEEKRFLKEETLREMFAPRVNIPSSDGLPLSFGYGFAVESDETGRLGYQLGETLSWSGSGNTYFFIHPEKRLTAVLMTHVLTGADLKRTREIRSVLNRAAEIHLIE